MRDVVLFPYLATVELNITFSSNESLSVGWFSLYYPPNSQIFGI